MTGPNERLESRRDRACYILLSRPRLLLFANRERARTRQKLSLFAIGLRRRRRHTAHRRRRRHWGRSLGLRGCSSNGTEWARSDKNAKKYMGKNRRTCRKSRKLHGSWIIGLFFLYNLLFLARGPLESKSLKKQSKKKLMYLLTMFLTTRLKD